jgi:hypothetical protein
MDDLEYRFARLERRVEWLVMALAVATLALIAYLPLVSVGGELGSYPSTNSATSPQGLAATGRRTSVTSLGFQRMPLGGAPLSAVGIHAGVSYW